MAEMLRYRVILEPEAPEDGGFNVIIPAFPTAHTCGDTIQECKANAIEVIEMMLEHYRELDLPMPEPDALDAPVLFVDIHPPAA